MAWAAAPAAPAAFQRPQRAAGMAHVRSTQQLPRRHTRRLAAAANDGGGNSTPSQPPPPLSDPALHPNLLAEETLLSEDEALDDARGEEGAEWPAAAAAAAAATTDEVSSVKAEVAELRALLTAQAQLVQSQQRHMEALQQGSRAQAAAAAAPAADGSTALLDSLGKEEAARASRAAAEAKLHDRRGLGLYDARFHSTSWGATPGDYRVLPKRIFLVRHAESEGNVDNLAYTYMPDPSVPLTARGWQQAMAAGDRLRGAMEAANEGRPYKLFFYTSPYLRSRQTYEGLAQAFAPEQMQGVQEEVQLREQDFGNFQDVEGKRREKAERLRFGRFFYRFPNGESGADVYDRMTIFEDHLVRDINAGRFADNTSLVLVTHGLALRVFLMRWFHWTVAEFLSVFNPPNAEPLMLERMPPGEDDARPGGPAAWTHTKALYRLSESSQELLKGVTPEMCQTSWAPRGINPLDPADSLLLPDKQLRMQ